MHRRCWELAYSQCTDDAGNSQFELIEEEDAVFEGRLGAVGGRLVQAVLQGRPVLGVCSDELMYVTVLAEGSVMRRRVPVHVLHVDVSVADGQQVLDVAYAVEVRGDVERGEALLADGVDVEARHGEEDGEERGVAVLGGDVQRRRAVLVAAVHLATVHAQQQARLLHVVVVAAARLVQRRVAEAVGDVSARALVEQHGEEVRAGVLAGHAAAGRHSAQVAPRVLNASDVDQLVEVSRDVSACRHAAPPADMVHYTRVRATKTGRHELTVTSTNYAADASNTPPLTLANHAADASNTPISVDVKMTPMSIKPQL